MMLDYMGGVLILTRLLLCFGKRVLISFCFYYYIDVYLGTVSNIYF